MDGVKNFLLTSVAIVSCPSSCFGFFCLSVPFFLFCYKCVSSIDRQENLYCVIVLWKVTSFLFVKLNVHSSLKYTLKFLMTSVAIVSCPPSCFGFFCLSVPIFLFCYKCFLLQNMIRILIVLIKIFRKNQYYK